MQILEVDRGFIDSLVFEENPGEESELKAKMDSYCSKFGIKTHAELIDKADSSSFESSICSEILNTAHLLNAYSQN